MPRKTVTVLTDDFDGSELPETTAPLKVAVGRNAYNLYLSDKNLEKFLDLLNPYLENAEKADGAPGSSTGVGRRAGSNADQERTKKARAWAIESGFKFKNAAGEEKTLGDRGRVPDAVIDGWVAAGEPEVG